MGRASAWLAREELPAQRRPRDTALLLAEAIDATRLGLRVRENAPACVGVAELYVDRDSLTAFRLGNDVGHSPAMALLVAPPNLNHSVAGTGPASVANALNVCMGTRCPRVNRMRHNLTAGEFNVPDGAFSRRSCGLGPGACKKYFGRIEACRHDRTDKDGNQNK